MQQQISGGSMSGKVRVYEVAKQLNLDPKQVVGLFQAIGVAEVRNHMSSVDPEAVERVKRHLEKQRTHDVVEERIRSDGRVIKRRAIAKASSTSAPTEAESLPASSPSPRSVSTPAVATTRGRHDGTSPAPAGAWTKPAAGSPATPARGRKSTDDVPSPHEPNGHTALEPAALRERESGRLPIPDGAAPPLPARGQNLDERRVSRPVEPAAAQVRAGRHLVALLVAVSERAMAVGASGRFPNLQPGLHLLFALPEASARAQGRHGEPKDDAAAATAPPWGRKRIWTGRQEHVSLPHTCRRVFLARSAGTPMRQANANDSDRLQ